jgi:hypothetical protein
VKFSKKFIHLLSKQEIHIVAFDVPYPADYGGAIDVFHRIKALHALGLEITLHVFEYGRARQETLNAYAKVIYYPRKRSVFHLFSRRPFIVQSRKNASLIQNLRKNNAPILFEGLHTTYHLEHPDIQKRLTFVRMHNIEHTYYRGLQKRSNFVQRLFFRQEAIKLSRYESILKNASHVLAITEKDAEHFKQYNRNTHFLPASFPDSEGRFTPVKRYALFHGNLSVAENIQALQWIVQTLRPILDGTFPLIVAGKNPGKAVQKICKHPHIELIANPSEKKLDQLVQEAQIHVLYTGMSTGIKLKLLACVHSSGHILVNNKMVEDTPLESFCVVANDPKEFKIHFLGLQQHQLDKASFDKRVACIQSQFSTRQNCHLIKDLIDHEAVS